MAPALLGAGPSFLVPSAAAQALLVGSRPVAGSFLPRAPRQLTFREAPDPRPAPARRVTLEFTVPTHVGLGAALALRRGADGIWTGEGLQLWIVGDWSVDAVVRGTATAVVVPFTVRVAQQENSRKVGGARRPAVGSYQRKRG